MFMTIERTAENIVVTLPASFDIKEIQRFLDYLRFKEIVAKSKATQKEIDELARLVNKSWWEKNRNLYLSEL